MTEYLSDIIPENNYGISSRPLSDDIEAFHQYDGYDEDLKKDLMGLRNKISMDSDWGVICSYGGDRDTYEVYSALASAGYDVRGMVDSSTMDRKAVKLIESVAPDIDTDQSSKKNKKLKKKRKKAEKIMYERMSANETARNILTRNRVSFNADDNIMSFTLKDIMNPNGGM